MSEKEKSYAKYYLIGYVTMRLRYETLTFRIALMEGDKTIMFINPFSSLVVVQWGKGTLHNLSKVFCPIKKPKYSFEINMLIIITSVVLC